MSDIGGSGAGGGDGHNQTRNTVDLGAGIDPQFVMLRDSLREKILEFIGRRQASDEWRRRFPELARRIEELLFRKFPNKNEYYNMVMGSLEPQLQYAIQTLSSQSREMARQRASSMNPNVMVSSSSSNYNMIPTPGIAQVTSRNSGLYVTDSIDLLLSGTRRVPRNANMGTLLPGAAHDEHANRLLSMGIKTKHDCSRVSNNNSNNNLVTNIVDPSETNIILQQVAHAPPETVKEVRKKPKFSCPVCMNDLVDASSTICGHIFCQTCIKASIKAQKKCPTCRRKLTMHNFHRVYLPTME